METDQSSRYLPEDIKLIIDPDKQREAFFAHPENSLLAMLSDENKIVRELAARKILKARSPPQVPQINVDANSYIDLIDRNSFSNHQFCDASLTKK